MSSVFAPAPDSRLEFRPAAHGLEEATRAFYRRDTPTVARDLLGAWLARCHRGKWYGARIVETEAYLGAADRAAHSWGGRRTPRVEPMYMDGGHLYVFFVYGMHHCANIVTRKEGMAEAVLLRAAEGPPGTPLRLMAGPGRLCAALGITRDASGFDLLCGGEIRLFTRQGPPPKIEVSARIGIAYAGEAKDWPLRFCLEDSPALSGRNLKDPDERGKSRSSGSR